MSTGRGRSASGEADCAASARAATIGAAIGFGLQQPFIGFPLWAVLQGAAAWAAARDPWFLETWPRHLAKPTYLSA